MNNIQLLSPEAFRTEDIALYTLRNGRLVMQVTNFGARVVSLWTPDKQGHYADIAIGYNSIEQYLHNKGERFIGCVVGRYANRIANGTFSLNGKDYHLPVNNNGQTLHGGLKGLDSVVFTVTRCTENEIEFFYLSPDGEEGFPGALSLTMTYTLTPDDAFKITYRATCDQPTVVNLSHHSFFNLKGEGKGLITDHELCINADHITPVNRLLIPTGELLAVNDTPFDFRRPHLIGERMYDQHPQIAIGNGYDHNFVLRKADSMPEPGASGSLTLAATLHEASGGRRMEVWTDQPGIQFYSGYHFTGAMGKYGKPHERYGSLALETQHFPDAPNQPTFPSSVLHPGETYRHTCMYIFS